MTNRALVIIDVQNDFTEGGALAVTGGAAVAAAVSRWREQEPYPAVVLTRDWHIEPGDHFAAEPDFVDAWPHHCVAGTPGAEFHPDLLVEATDTVFSKGQYSPGYSGFEGVDAAGTGLEDWLRGRSITSLDVCGIATDHCVRATTLDALEAGFAVRVLTDLCAGVAPESTAAALAEMAAAGAELVRTEQPVSS